MQYPPPQPQPPLQPVKKKSGCLMWLMIVLGVLALVGIVTGIFVYRYVSSTEGQKTVTLLGEGAKLAAESANAPGTPELKKIGCTTPAVIDLERLTAITNSFADGGAKPSGKGEFALMVSCTVGHFASNAPTCDQVAMTYRTAVGTPASKYAAVVQVQGKQRPECSALYGVDGLKIRDLDLKANE